MVKYGRNFNKKKTSKTAKTRSRVARAPVKAVVDNSRAISLLNQKVNGHIQRNYHTCVFNPSYSLSPSTPLCFPANDFTRDSQGGGKIYFPIYTGTAPALETSAAIASTWKRYDPSLTFGLAPPHRMWDDNNNDSVSKSVYQPIYAEYRINFGRQKQAVTQPDTYIRIDIVKAKRIYLNSLFHKYSLPNSLGSLQDMAVSNAQQSRNSYNPALFSVKTRWLKLPKVDSDTINTSRTHVLKMNFPKTLIKLDLDSVGGVTEEFALGVDPKVPEWVIISASTKPVDSDTSPLTITMTRKIVWRDQQGIEM